MKDSTILLLTKAYNTAQHHFTFGKAITKPCAIVPNEFDPLNVECDVFSKGDLEALDVVIECLQAIDAVGALKNKGVSAFALSEAKLFFTSVFIKYLQSDHTLDEMQSVNETLDAMIHELVRLERKAQPATAKPVKSTYDFIREKVATLSPDELRVFLSMERGKRLPKFIQDWRAELPCVVSDKTFANSLSRARNSFRAETKRSKRKK